MDLPMLLSRPHRVVFEGWETTTTRLQSAGWQLAAQEDFRDGRLQLAMNHRPSGLSMVSDSQEYDYYRRMDSRGRGDSIITFVVRQLVGRTINFMCTELPSFHAIDAAPQFVERQVKTLEDLAVFAVPLVRTEEILVEPATVQDLLEQIKKMQAPELAAIRERNRKRAAQEGSRDYGAIQQQRFHAQLVSVA